MRRVGLATAKGEREAGKWGSGSGRAGGVCVTTAGDDLPARYYTAAARAAAAPWDTDEARVAAIAQGHAYGALREANAKHQDPRTNLARAALRRAHRAPLLGERDASV